MEKRTGGGAPGILYMPRGSMTAEQFADMLERKPLPQTKLFDDLYFMGHSFVGCLMLKTSDGIIMMDALCRDEDWENIILPKMQQEGLDPADIRILLITHGHVDHYGCARKIRQISGCKVYMSAVDEVFMNEHPLLREGIPTLRQGPGHTPEVDGYITDGDTVRLGDTEVEIFSTPGHTPGGLSFIFPVHDGGEAHLVGLWGGTKIPRNHQAASQYLNSILHFQTECEKRGVDVSVQAHPFVDYSLQRRLFHGKLAERKAREPHPMVMGTERFQQFLSCIRAEAEQTLAELGPDETRKE